MWVISGELEQAINTCIELTEQEPQFFLLSRKVFGLNYLLLTVQEEPLKASLVAPRVPFVAQSFR